MLDQKIRVASEALARTVDRRNFLKVAGGAVVTGIVGLAMGPALGGREKAFAAPRVPNVPGCNPPGPYCNTDGVNEPNACRGGSCYQHHNTSNQIIDCHLDTMYQITGCWTTASANGYWTCCDCRCTGNITCGCAQYTAATGVFPD